MASHHGIVPISALQTEDRSRTENTCVSEQTTMTQIPNKRHQDRVEIRRDMTSYFNRFLEMNEDIFLNIDTLPVHVYYMYIQVDYMLL